MRQSQPASVESEDAELRALQESRSIPELVEASSALAQGRTAEANTILDDYLDKHPRNLLALHLSAGVALGLRDLDTAERCAREVAQRVPSFAAGSILLANALVQQSRVVDAVQVIETLRRRTPGDAAQACFLARLLTEIGRHERAATVYEQVLAASPAARDIWILYADTLRFLGRSDDAKHALRRALALDPCRGPAWWALANHYPSELGEHDAAQVRGALKLRKSAPQDASLLHIALSILLHRAGRHAESFEHVAAGKRLAAAALPYDPDRTSREITRWTELPATTFRKPAGSAAEAQPIFIVGMPRSGSTLVERILNRHSKIEGAGELPVLPRLVETLRMRSTGGESLQETVAALSQAELDRLGTAYLEGSRDYRRSDKPRFVDKLHLNWRHVGLLGRMLPGAKLIDVRRNPLDCCWSNFRQVFSANHPAANDLRHIGRWYADYVRLMDWYEQVVPRAVLRVDYEKLVEEPERTTAQIMRFIGEEFEPGMLDFHLSTEPVATLSSEQVRQPLNREGIGVAAPYRAWLGPLVEALGPLADDA